MSDAKPRGFLPSMDDDEEDEDFVGENEFGERVSRKPEPKKPAAKATKKASKKSGAKRVRKSASGSEDRRSGGRSSKPRR